MYGVFVLQFGLSVADLAALSKHWELAQRLTELDATHSYTQREEEDKEEEAGVDMEGIGDDQTAGDDNNSENDNYNDNNANEQDAQVNETYHRIAIYD